MIERASHLCCNQQQYNVMFSRTASDTHLLESWWKLSGTKCPSSQPKVWHISLSTSLFLLLILKGSEVCIWKTWKCLYRWGSLWSRQNSATTGHVLFMCLYFILNLSKHFLWRDGNSFPSSSKKTNLFQESIHPVLSH